MSKKRLTLACVAIAGLIFIPSVIFDKPLYGLIAAFFDWLPLFTGWMRYTDSHKPPVAHIILTVAAYLLFIGWLSVPALHFARTAFLMVWFLAVVVGADIS
ncbi:MAG: hypothetical protein ACP5SB_02325 [Caldisericaceae bacterium]